MKNAWLIMEALLIPCILCFILFVVVPNFIACGHQTQQRILMERLDQAEWLRYMESDGMTNINLRFGNAARPEVYCIPSSMFSRDDLRDAGFSYLRVEDGWEIWGLKGEKR